MHNFKKAILSTISFILIFAVISILVIVPYWNSEVDYFQDSQLREDLAGQIDCIVIGASHALTAFDTNIIDEKLGCFSYNLSGSMMTLDSKYYFLKKELERNPVETVIIEISYDTLGRNESNEYGIGDEVTISRLDSTSERLSYLAKYVSIDDWLNLYSRHFISSLASYTDVLRGQDVCNVDKTKKGYNPASASNLSLSPESAKSKFNSMQCSANYLDENVAKLNKLVNLCKMHNVRIIFVVTPLSNSLLWSMDGLDNFQNWLHDYSQIIGCEVYDLNLLKNYYSLFSDEHSFRDADHIGGIGSETFSIALCDLIQRTNEGQTVSDEFYDSYTSLKLDSPYMQYIEP